MLNRWYRQDTDAVIVASHNDTDILLLVDIEDLSKVSNINDKWLIATTEDGIHAYAIIDNKPVLMANLIMDVELSTKIQVEYINGKYNDLRKDNLQILP